MFNSHRFKYIGSIAAVLATTAAAPALAASSVALNGDGDLSPDRASAQITVTVQCDAPINVGETKTGTLRVHILQPSGRVINIGIGTAPATCDGNSADVVIDVAAIPGLKFKAGPATAIFNLTEETRDSNSVIVGSATLESGAKVRLRP